MREQKTAVLVSLLAIAAGCTSRTSSPPVPTPGIPQVLTPAEPAAYSYRFSPNVYRYTFQQTAEIHAEGTADTLPSRIETRATLVVTVVTEADSSTGVTVSVDSISISTEGSIPPGRPPQSLKLDSVFYAKFSPTGVVTKSYLPDSLCAYNQFVTAAHDVVLPELASEEVRSPTNQVYSDTIAGRACRAGIEIQLVTTRQLNDPGGNPAEFSLRQQTEMQGTGLLRRDSITVNGSISSHGTVFFGTANRLPSRVQMASDGRITVRLANSTTIFQQRSTQVIQLEGIQSPNP